MSTATVLLDAPGPRARARHRAVSALTLAVAVLLAWVVYSRLAAKGQLTAEKWAPFLTADLWRTYVLPGVAGTLTAA
ncbi:MAG TPA: amino acid ABC transporter permease, partial [Mycobacterium sp.]|nr:amino acid ABC transporter permease [Mycobacterium sp.]